jgi:periplasmic mercuric ion binding protein
MLRILAFSLLTLLTVALVAAPPKDATVTLTVTGLHCEPCADTVQEALLKVKGVKEAKVSYDDKEAVVKYDAGACKVDDLLKAVREAKGMSKYDATVKKK